MKKVIMINLNSLAFNIDEDAYNLLETYLNEIKNHFQNTEWKEEILEDIETRISEIFTEKLNNNKQVINTKDVEDAINILGKPQDITGEQTEVTPSKLKENKNSKRLYRNRDEGIIAGICSGLGYYFDVDPVWFRLIFILGVFFGGISILIYAIMWIIIPCATTTAEKLEMKGKKINISDIEKKIKSRLNTLKDELNEFEEKIKKVDKESIKNNFQTKFKNLENEIKENSLTNEVASFLTIIIRIISVFLGIILFFATLVLMFFIILWLLGFESFHFKDFFFKGNFSVFISTFIENPIIRYIVLASLIIVIFVPLLMFIIFNLKLIFNLKKVSFLRYVLSILSIIGLLGIIVAIIHFERNLNESFTTTDIINLTQYDTLYLSLNENHNLLKEADIHVFKKGMKQEIVVAKSNNNENILYFKPQLIIKKSNNNQFYIEIVKKSKSSSKYLAEFNIKKVNYEIDIRENKINLNKYAKIEGDEVYRNQQVLIYVYIPKGKFINFMSDFDEMIEEIQLFEKSEKIPKKNTIWVMTEDGLISRSNNSNDRESIKNTDTTIIDTFDKVVIDKSKLNV